jgi:arylformamidase
LTHLTLGVHTGTHVDAPCHFLPGQQPGVDTLDLSILVGPALVVDVADEVSEITAEVVRSLNIPVGTERLLFKTRNRLLWEIEPLIFREDFVAVEVSGARELVKMGIKLVGVDYLSVAPYQDGVPTHQVLLQAGVIPVEGMDLRDVPAGVYQLVCLPMKLVGCDGAPVRAILISD